MTRTSPKVTVLIGTYNRPDYLHEAIQSVVNQSMEDWELLVMNDGGVDVGGIVGKFQDSRIRYFHDPVNRKLPYRLNFGLREGKGKYIAYLGDDDVYYPNHLSVLSKALDDDPTVGVVYSDLYAVQFVKDEKQGKRYPLHKFIQVSRDFNRDFMFLYNHTLHVSLMHHRDLALQAGGYDERVRVLVDWNITRKLCFYTDFKYVPVLTGEYYMPIGKSDRISNLEREDQENFKQNLRKIIADLPPEPWPKVDRMAMIFPVRKWDEATIALLTELIDNLCYPARIILVNNSALKSEFQCREKLGALGELKHIAIVTPPARLSELGAYRFGAQKSDADYVYLASKGAKTDLGARLISGREHLKRGGSDGVKWSVEQERAGAYNTLIKRTVFLERTDPRGGTMDVVVSLVPQEPPKSFRFDFFMHQAMKERDKGNHEAAYALLKEAEKVTEGGSTDQFLADLYSRICFDLKRYDEAEVKCRALVERGYGADNWLRLGRILQARGKYQEAYESYRKGLEEIGLKESDLDSDVFPIALPDDFGSFIAVIGMAECRLESGNLIDAARLFRKAARLKANSHRTFLGFGKLFLRTNELGRAEEALLVAERADATDQETYRALGRVYEKRKEMEKAYQVYCRAFAQDNWPEDAAERLYALGSRLGRWEDLKGIFEKALKQRPGCPEVKRRLTDVYGELGDCTKAAEAVQRGVTLGADNRRLQTHC